jgi:hypothetical protein
VAGREGVPGEPAAGDGVDEDAREGAGGGKKPWRQKGTGRARQGSIRSPQWRGGGSVFGPRPNRNFKQDLPKQVKLAGAALGVQRARAGRRRDRDRALVLRCAEDEVWVCCELLGSRSARATCCC